MLGGDGSDTTAAAKAYLLSHNQLFLANLFMIGEIDDPAVIKLTDWEAPLAWPIFGTFKPGVTKRGQVSSDIGLKVAALDFEWSPPLTPFTQDVATANPYQLAQLSFYDNKKFRMWRTIMPTPGDANTYGAYILFGGRVADSEVSRGKIKFTINSLLDVVNQMVPPNVIAVTNSLAGYKGATPVLADGETIVPKFTVVAPSNTTTILGACTAPTPNKIYGDNKFQHGFLVFSSGSLQGFWSAVGTSNNFVQPIIGGGSVQYNRFIVYNQFPWDPAPGDTFYVSTAFPSNASPFQFVPAPQAAI
jgi:hypothetical protein